MNLLQIIWILIIFLGLYIASIEYKKHIIARYIRNHIKNSRQKKVDFHVLRYKESLTRKPASTISVAIPLAITLIVALIVYKYVFFAVPVSNSMLPTFARGDLVVYQTYNTTPEIGDIIMFKILGKDKPVTHRVYSKDLGFIQTKGDNGGVDNWNLYPENVRAKAIIVNGKPIVIKHVGSYITGELQSGNENAVFKAMSKFIKKGREAGLAIFSIAMLLYLIISAYDMSTHRYYKRR